jgi:leader peptidase (prepilin peptidase)/N-methyltransferase
MAQILIASLGWACGALVNYLADVLPRRMRLVAPFCTACERPQPVWNYLVWPRRCPACGRRRDRRAWVVELLAIAAALWLWQSPPQRLGFLLGLALLTYFGVVAVIDLEHRLILLPLTLVGVALGLGAGIWLQWQKTGQLGLAVAYTILGGLGGFTIMLLFYLLGALFARWAARKSGEELNEEALGFGDVHLGLIIGLSLGWPAVIIGLMAGVLFGGLASFIYLIVKLIAGRHRWFAAIPYGPYLIAGAVFLLFFREVLVGA